MARTVLLCVAAAALAGCAAREPEPQPQPDVTVYVGKRDPAHEIPERFRQPHRQQIEERQRAADFQQVAHQLHERVRSDPAFGGLILRWQPEPHAVVMFTGDAEARLRRYTSDPRFKAMSVELTLAQLERMKSRMGEQLSRLNLGCFSVDGDEEHNAVTVGAPPDALARIRAAIASGQVKPPPKLRLVEGRCPEFR